MSIPLSLVFLKVLIIKLFDDRIRSCSCERYLLKGRVYSIGVTNRGPIRTIGLEYRGKPRTSFIALPAISADANDTKA